VTNLDGIWIRPRKVKPHARRDSADIPIGKGLDSTPKDLSIDEGFVALKVDHHADIVRKGHPSDTVASAAKRLGVEDHPNFDPRHGIYDPTIVRGHKNLISHMSSDRRLGHTANEGHPEH